MVAGQKIAHQLDQVGFAKGLPDPSRREPIFRGVTAGVGRPHELSGVERRPDQTVAAQTAQSALDRHNGDRCRRRVGTSVPQALDQRHGNVEKSPRVAIHVSDSVDTHVENERIVLGCAHPRMPRAEEAGDDERADAMQPTETPSLP